MLNDGVLHLAQRFVCHSGYVTRVSRLHDLLGRTVLLGITFSTPLETARWIVARFRRNDAGGALARSRSMLYPGPRLARRFPSLCTFALERGLPTSRRFGCILAEGYWCTTVALAAKRRFGIPVIADVHGAEPEEVLEEARTINAFVTRRVALLSRIEEQIINEADGLVVVSSRMLEHLHRKYGRELPPAAVVTCSAATAGRAPTGAVPPRSRPLVVYSGTLYGWQCFEQTLGYWREINERIECDFAVYTPMPDIARSRVARYFGPDAFRNRIKIERVPPEQLVEVLSLADAGMLIRDDRVTNRVSSPTKFAEYLSGGLAVITTPYAGGVARSVEDENLGVVVAPDCNPTDVDLIVSTLKSVMRDREHWRRRLVAAADAHFDASRQSNALAGLIDAVVSHGTAVI